MKKINPLVMGILNITDNSFYDGGKYIELVLAKKRVDEMIAEGAHIIDVGGFSSKPGSTLPSINEELNRIIPIIDYIEDKNIDFSVDTCRSEVVEKIIKYKNLRYINDISGLDDERILDMISGTDIGYILMHIRGTPACMQKNTDYEDILSDIYDFLRLKIDIIKSKGVGNIIIDPGFGFGKSIEDNYIIMKNLSKFTKLGYPILIGISRKSMIYKLVNSDPNSVVSESASLNLFAMNKGAHIIRTHDVKLTKNLISIYNMLK